MKVAVLSESPADEAAVRILLDGILGRETHPPAIPPLRTRGWPSVLGVLPTVIMSLYYRTDAEALVVVVDSNHSPVHQEGPSRPCEHGDRCRLCQLRQAASRVESRLRPVAGRPKLNTAFGLAVPAIEAWYLYGRKEGVSEFAWMRGLESGSYPYTRAQLKHETYNTDRPSLELETARAIEEARRLAQDIAPLERWFRNGFGSLADDVQRWEAESAGGFET